jgi:hypothetical protein
MREGFSLCAPGKGAQGRKIGNILKFEISNLRSEIEIMDRRGD